MRRLRSFVDPRIPGSLGHRLRRRRFDFLLALLEPVDKPISVLDVGGEEIFWHNMGLATDPEFQFTILNLFADSVILPNFSCQIGDARTMPQFENGQFDLVFSNSVIEHVGDLSDQKRMGQEIRRVGKRYFVQTPNRRFPIEPHFMFPLFQFFPEPLKVFLICHLPITHAKTRWTREQALEVARDIRLLTHRELRMIFPHATIRRERVLGLSKSFMVYEGWPTDGIRRSR